MGHYRSEMGFEGFDREREEHRRRRRASVERGIRRDAIERGLTAVLADILLDSSSYTHRAERLGEEDELPRAGEVG